MEYKIRDSVWKGTIITKPLRFSGDREALEMFKRHLNIKVTSKITVRRLHPYGIDCKVQGSLPKMRREESVVLNTDSLSGEKIILQRIL